MIVHFVEVGGIVDCQFLSFLSIINNKNRTSFIKISYIVFSYDLFGPFFSIWPHIKLCISVLLAAYGLTLNYVYQFP